MTGSSRSNPVGARVCFIVPTLKRPDFLRRCLEAIEKQTVPPASILVGIRPDDEASHAVVMTLSQRMRVSAVEAKGVGVIGSMASCLGHATEEFVALVDDDVELPAHWLETMVGHLASYPNALAAAGRDLLQDHPEMRLSEKRVADVGRVHWYGRITGNHHRGNGKPRFVDVLRGSNCLFRGSFLREVGFDQCLRGQGAQVNWELALAFQAMGRHAPFFYDPSVGVIHHTAPRCDADTVHRGRFHAGSIADISFNETFVTAKYAPGWRRAAILAYQILVGTPLAPGAAHIVKRILSGDEQLVTRVRATFTGRFQALSEARKEIQTRQPCPL